MLCFTYRLSQVARSLGSDLALDETYRFVRAEYRKALRLPSEPSTP